GPDPAPVVDRLAGLIGLTATQKARDIFQNQYIFTAGGQRERAVDGQTEISDVREGGVILPFNQIFWRNKICGGFDQVGTASRGGGRCRERGGPCGQDERERG